MALKEDSAYEIGLFAYSFSLLKFGRFLCPPLNGFSGLVHLKFEFGKRTLWRMLQYYDDPRSF